jgi:hypothetical protein
MQETRVLFPSEQQILNFPFSPSHTSRITKPSSLKLATSGITHPSDAQRGESYKMAFIKAYLLLQGLTFSSIACIVEYIFLNIIIILQ